MTSLSKTFANWLFQGHIASDGLKERGQDDLAERLRSTLNEVDQVWAKELGKDYVAAKLEMFDLYEKIVEGVTPNGL